MSAIGSFAGCAAQQLLDIIAAITGTYYSKKYAAVVRRLGLPRAESSKGRGFIAIQIDGLSHSHLEAAMEMGYAPHLWRMLRRGEFLLQPWRSGLPCTTPAAQAGIMFGNNDDIPAFRWYDKDSGESIVCKPPRTLKSIQDRVSSGRPGILAGGSSFMNMFDGDAALSMFTLAAMNRKRFFESVRGLGFLLLFALNPFRSLKTIVLAVWEYLTDLVQHISASRRGQGRHSLHRSFPVFRVMSNVVFREIQTFAVMVDIYRGVPSIYTTFYGYDELAHHYGPLSRVALRALDAVDRCVRQVDSLRRVALTRQYDLYILSDHGMTSAQPFQLAYGQTLGELIRDLIGDGLRVNERSGDEQQGALQALYLMDELAAIEANVPPPLAHVPRRIRKLVAQRMPLSDEDRSSFDLLRCTDVVVHNSGSMSHVYFDVTPRQMNISEVASVYPSLMCELAAHPGIWLVIGREDQQVVVMSSEGVLQLDCPYRVEGKDPLADLPAPRVVAEQVRRLALFPHSGDLVLMGTYDPKSQVVSCFEQQWACHGGIGGPQEIAFMIIPHEVDWDLGEVAQATEIYPLFANRYALQPPGMGDSSAVLGWVGHGVVPARALSQAGTSPHLGASVEQQDVE